MKRSTFLLGALIATLSGPINAQTQAGLDASAKAEMARWALQTESGENDNRLADSVMRAFFVATAWKPSGVSPVEVNSALAPLKARFPDYRLNYKSDEDYCPVLRAIRDAESSANKRRIQSLDMHLKVLLISMLHNDLTQLRLLEGITGKPTEDAAIDKVFLDQLQEMKSDDLLIGWSNVDYSDSPLSARDCN